MKIRAIVTIDLPNAVAPDADSRSSIEAAVHDLEASLEDAVMDCLGFPGFVGRDAKCQIQFIEE